MADKNFLTEIIDADLAEGKVSEIHTRFPPEPNGYLHIGSAKAIYINWSIAKAYGGKFNLRLDDTNPAREDVEYVNSILEDLHWLGADPDGGVFYGSDYFEQCYEYAEKLIREGKAYVDDLTRDEMREYRGSDAGKPSRPSPWRDRTPEENLDLFRRMRAGEFKEGEKTLRAKIDLASPNMNMRDPAIYRIKYEHHHRQGDKWCIYPMYDFAHPIQDAIEGITHSMCSLEFENHRPLYEWVIENIFGGEFPKQREFARLNMTNTVMSKRYLRELVETGMVDGWDDPRMPTLCGLRRRGYTPTSIFTFVREAGISKADNLIDMRQLEACVRSELDLTAQRRVAVLRPVKLIVDNYPAGRTEDFCLANNPNREACDCSTRNCVFSRELWIEADDFAEVPPPKFKRLTVGGEVRLMGHPLHRRPRDRLRQPRRRPQGQGHHPLGQRRPLHRGRGAAVRQAVHPREHEQPARGDQLQGLPQPGQRDRLHRLQAGAGPGRRKAGGEVPVRPQRLLHPRFPSPRRVQPGGDPAGQLQARQAGRLPRQVT